LSGVLAAAERYGVIGLVAPNSTQHHQVGSSAVLPTIPEHQRNGIHHVPNAGGVVPQPGPSHLTANNPDLLITLRNNTLPGSGALLPGNASQLPSVATPKLSSIASKLHAIAAPQLPNTPQLPGGTVQAPQVPGTDQERSASGGSNTSSGRGKNLLLKINHMEKKILTFSVNFFFFNFFG
jgi:hypothetical protein